MWVNMEEEAKRHDRCLSPLNQATMELESISSAMGMLERGTRAQLHALINTYKESQATLATRGINCIQKLSTYDAAASKAFAQEYHFDLILRADGHDAFSYKDMTIFIQSSKTLSASDGLPESTSSPTSALHPPNASLVCLPWAD